MSNSQKHIALLGRYVATGNLQLLQENLVIDESVDLTKANILLRYLLSVAFKYNKPESVQVIFEAYRSLYPYTLNTEVDVKVTPTLDGEINQEIADIDLTNLSLFTQMFLDDDFTIENLAISALGLPYYNAVRILTELTRYPSSDMVVAAAAKVFEVYGEQPDYSLETILSEADKHNSNKLYNYIANLYKQVAPYANQPKYMIMLDPVPFETDFDLPPARKTEPLDLTVLLNYAYDNVTKFADVFEDESVGELLTKMTDLVTNDKKMQYLLFLELTLKHEPNDIELLKILGPINPNTGNLDLIYGDNEGLTLADVEIFTVDSEFSNNSSSLFNNNNNNKIPIIINAGETVNDVERKLENINDDLASNNATMIDTVAEFDDDTAKYIDLTVNLYTNYMFYSLTVNNDDNSDIVLDWFTGNCQICLLQLASRYHAVRRPILCGGWNGCYCSWECVAQHIDQLEEDGVDTEENYDIVRQMIIIYRNQIDQYGIYERRLVNVESEEEVEDNE